MPFKPLDFLITVPALGAVVVSFFLAYSGPVGSGSVCLKSENGEWFFPLDAAETVKVSGPLGETVVEISGGGARISSSPCLNKTCVASGAVRSPGQWAACLPNRVMLYIGEGKNENDVDAASW